MAVLHSLLRAALPFLSLISPSIQAVGTLRVDDEHRGTISAVTVTGPTTGTATGAGTATPTPIPLLGTQSEPVAVEGAYLIAFKEDYRYVSQTYFTYLWGTTSKVWKGGTSLS